MVTIYATFFLIFAPVYMFGIFAGGESTRVSTKQLSSTFFSKCHFLGLNLV